ncbi:OmpA family protein [Enterobacter ludwigii]
MKYLLIPLMAIMATPALAGQFYRSDAHAWYNDDGEIEISSQLDASRTVTTPARSPGLLKPVTQTLPAAQLFALNSARLLAPSSSLQALARQLRQNNNALTVTLTGYTDSSGSSVHNQALSLRRAQSIQHWLAAMAPQHHYITYGLGESSPVATNLTRAGREQNRRVTVSIQGAAL